jgi:DNA-binding transcriptional regulator YhcF (GntR family)
MSPGQLERGPEIPVYRQIGDYYAALIRSGAIRPGDKLPSVAEVCRIWRVASRTAEQAMSVLKEGDLVETSPKGTFALGAPRTDSDNPVAK